MLSATTVGKDLDEHFRELGRWAEKKLAQLEGREEFKLSFAALFCVPERSSFDKTAAWTPVRAAISREADDFVDLRT